MSVEPWTGKGRGFKAGRGRPVTPPAGVSSADLGRPPYSRRDTAKAAATGPGRDAKASPAGALLLPRPPARTPSPRAPRRRAGGGFPCGVNS